MAESWKPTRTLQSTRIRTHTFLAYLHRRHYQSITELFSFEHGHSSKMLLYSVLFKTHPSWHVKLTEFASLTNLYLEMIKQLFRGGNELSNNTKEVSTRAREGGQGEGWKRARNSIYSVHLCHIHQGIVLAALHLLFWKRIQV